MGDKSSAFVKGGCGCLLAFVGIAGCAVLFGARVHINLGGAILLFLGGGAVGLIALAFYNRGKSDRGVEEFRRQQAREREREWRREREEEERDDFDDT